MARDKAEHGKRVRGERAARSIQRVRDRGPLYDSTLRAAAADKNEDNGDAGDEEAQVQLLSMPHVCLETCKRHCPFGGAGYLHFCAVCNMHSVNGKTDCQRCVCLKKAQTPFKDRLGGTCAAYLVGRPCDC